MSENEDRERAWEAWAAKKVSDHSLPWQELAAKTQAFLAAYDDAKEAFLAGWRAGAEAYLKYLKDAKQEEP